MSDLMQSWVRIGTAVVIAGAVASGAWFMAVLHTSVETMSNTLQGIDDKLESLPSLSFQVTDNGDDIRQVQEQIRWMKEDTAADVRWLEERVAVHQMYVETLRRVMESAGLETPSMPDLPKRPKKQARGGP